MKTNMKKISEYVVEWLNSYATNSERKGYVLGVSGGIDSAVVSTLCSKTGLPVLILEMPIHQDADQVYRAQKHIKWLKQNYPNVTSKEIKLTDTYDTIYEAFIPKSEEISKDDFEFSMANTRSRLRMTTLYQFAGMYKMLVAGTGNKVEDFGIGFFTKGGDQTVDLSPIADLMKSEVYALGEELGLITEILNAIPTDGLHEDSRTDEQQIGATYPELECAMKHIQLMENTLDRQEKLSIELTLTDRELEVIRIYNNFHNSNKHKMVEIPVCIIPDEVRYYELKENTFG